MKNSHASTPYILNGEIHFGSIIPSIVPPHHLLMYEVIRVEKFVPLFIQDHLGRLFQGVEKTGYSLMRTKNQLKSSIEELVACSTTGDGNIKLEFYFTEENKNEVESRFFFIATRYPSHELYLSGIRCAILEQERINPSIKSSNSLLRDLTNQIIEKQDMNEILLYSSGHITEGSRSNFFYIKKDTVFTAPDELVLSGVMRKKVLKIIHENNISFALKALPLEELSDISAAFITGTSPRVLPIRQIDHYFISSQHPLILFIRDKLQTEITNYIATYK